MSINPLVQVTFTDQFEREVRRLSKRYRRIRPDIQPLIEQLEAGELPGDQIPNMDYTVFKVRVKTAAFKKVKAGVIALSTTSKPVTKSSSSRCILNPISLISLPLKSERFSSRLKPSWSIQKMSPNRRIFRNYSASKDTEQKRERE
jgi:mRNA-degrading endonuclease RelE of RelBE toxin-antitoxin system